MVRAPLAVLLTAIVIGCSAATADTGSLLSANIGQEGGNAQTGVVGTLLPDPLTVGVQDDSGFPVPGLSVSFTVTGGGQISGCSCQTQVETTDSIGHAHVAIILGPAVGIDSVIVTPANFLYPAVAIFTESAVADSTAVGSMAIGQRSSGDAATPARQQDVDRAVRQLVHEATRRPRNAWIARITENAPFTPRT